MKGETSKWNWEQATSEAGVIPSEWGILGKVEKTVYWGEKNSQPCQMALAGEVKQELKTSH